MRYAVAIFLSALVLCLMFIGSPAALHNQASVTASDISGRVLGVSEEASARALDMLKSDMRNTLPANRVEPPALPVPMDSWCRFDGVFQGLAFDPVSGVELYARDPDVPAPIASITKLMTALVFLDHNPGWDENYQVRADDRVEGGQIHIFKGDILTVRDLFNISLTASGNSATQALVSVSGFNDDDFVAEMNIKAAELGMSQASFADPIGLLSGSAATPREVAVLLKEAMGHPEIKKALLEPRYTFVTAAGDKRTADNTDILLGQYPQDGISLSGGKTGHTNAAGYCFAGQFTDQSGHEIITVVLGTPNPSDRFRYAEELASWVFDNYQWQ